MRINIRSFYHEKPNHSSPPPARSLPRNRSNGLREILPQASAPIDAHDSTQSANRKCTENTNYKYA